MNQSKFTVIIPSKKIDKNLINCEFCIRKFYKDLKILLLVDENDFHDFYNKNTEIVSTGKVNVSKKRNIGIELANSEFYVFIDSDAYPKHPWLDSVEDVFLKNKKIGACGGPNLSPYSKLEEKKLISEIKKSFLVSQNADFLKYKKSKSGFIDFLPTCNLVVKRSAIENIEPMDSNLFAHEDISLNENIKKNGFKIYVENSSYVFHKDRLIKSFLKQRFIYGTEAFNVFLRYPCKASLKLFIATLPFISFLILIFLSPAMFYGFLTHGYWFFILFKLSLFGVISVLLVVLFESFRIFLGYKKDFLKIFSLILSSIYLPGLGQVLRPFLKWKIRRSIWVH